MKKLFIVFLFTTIVTTTQAQTFAEWFKQKKTQKKYLVEQITALQVYVGYVKKGYSIAKEGLNTISDFKRGDFNMHTDYFNSLKKVNPKIKHYAQIAEIVEMQVIIIQDCSSFRKQVRKSDAFNDVELDYIGRVVGRLLDNGIQTLDELISVTTDGKLDMKDDERLERIGQLCQEMTGQYTFVQSFSKETMVLATSRVKENKEVQNSRSLYGMNNK